MLSVMALIQTAAELKDESVDANINEMMQRDCPDELILGRVFNQVVDHAQKGIDYARGSVELDAISQFFFSDISSSMTAANSGTVDMAMGLPAPMVADIQLILCLQNTILPPPPAGAGLKRMSILRKRPNVSPEEFQVQWFDLHATLVKRLPGIQGYRQNLIIDGPRDEDGHMLVDGMVELWFPDTETIESAFRSGAGITLMTHANEFISEITTFLVRPIEVSGCS